MGTTSDEAWSVDPTLRFDRIHVVESLSDTGHASRTGKRLVEELQFLPSTAPMRIEYHPVGTQAEVSALLLAIVTEAQCGHFPLVHLEAHGEDRQPGQWTTSRGIVLASGELFSWNQLAPYLVEINKSTRLRLLVFVATCFGADIATLVRPLDRAPARVMIGPRGSISVSQLEKGTFAFYRSLFRTGNGGQALIDMNQATGGAFFPFTVEWLFLTILKGYYNEYTTDDQIAARVERVVAPMALAGVPAAQMSLARRQMRTFLSDRKSVFDACYQKFFFVDEHPEIADRFRMTFESCFEEAVRGDDV